MFRLFGIIILLAILGSAVGCGEIQITPTDQRNLDSAVRFYDSGDDAQTIKNANGTLQEDLERAVRNYLQKETQRRPMTFVLINQPH